jgi:hypothetical protein
MADGALDIEDHAALLEYLRSTHRIEAQESPAFETLAGGVSNRTVLVHRRGGDERPDWVIKQTLPKLRTKTGWFSDPSRARTSRSARHRVAREARPPGTIPRLIFEDPAQHCLALIRREASAKRTKEAIRSKGCCGLATGRRPSYRGVSVGLPSRSRA